MVYNIWPKAFGGNSLSAELDNDTFILEDLSKIHGYKRDSARDDRDWLID